MPSYATLRLPDGWQSGLGRASDFSSEPIDLAVDAISATFVPEPSMAVLLVMTGLVAAGRLRPF
jgi:hypothetical protein